MSEDDLKAAGAFDDAMQKLESAFESLKNSAGANYKFWNPVVNQQFPDRFPLPM